MLAVGRFAALAGLIIGAPTLRLRGDYLAIVTLGFGEIIPQAVNNGDNWFGHNVTNGPNGLTPIDQLGFGTPPQHVRVPARATVASSTSTTTTTGPGCS